MKETRPNTRSTQLYPLLFGSIVAEVVERDPRDGEGDPGDEAEAGHLAQRDARDERRQHHRPRLGDSVEHLLGRGVGAVTRGDMARRGRSGPGRVPP